MNTSNKKTSKPFRFYFFLDISILYASVIWGESCRNIPLALIQNLIQKDGELCLVRVKPEETGGGP